MNDYVLSQCAVSLAILAFVWFYLFLKLRRDNFRCDVRRLRDELFDFMWKNGHDYNTPAYRETRQMLNGIIRLSNRLTPLTFFLEGVFAVRTGSLDRLFQKLADSPKDELGEEIYRVRMKAVRLMLQFVFTRGMFGLFMRAILIIFLTARQVNKAKEWAQLRAERLLTIAYFVGNPNLSQKKYGGLLGYR